MDFDLNEDLYDNSDDYLTTNHISGDMMGLDYHETDHVMDNGVLGRNDDIIGESPVRNNVEGFVVADCSDLETDDDEEENDTGDTREDGLPDTNDVQHIIDNSNNNDEVDILEPAVGMKFDFPIEAFKFYDHYSHCKGFGAIKRSSHQRKKIVYHYMFSCNKYRPPKEERKGTTPCIRKRRRAVIGTNCKACITVADNDDGWVIARVHLEHNHELTPKSAFLISTHRSISNRFQKELESNENNGMAISENIKSVISHAGGYGKCTFTERDARNHVDRYRRKKLKELGCDDAVALIEYFEQKQIRDKNFFYTYSITEGSNLWNIFWAEGRGIACYKHFHDVIVVDSTYRTNRYNMSLALFGGVNHQFQNIVFACTCHFQVNFVVNIIT